METDAPRGRSSGAPSSYKRSPMAVDGAEPTGKGLGVAKGRGTIVKKRHNKTVSVLWGTNQLHKKAPKGTRGKFKNSVLESGVAAIPAQ